MDNEVLISLWDLGNVEIGYLYLAVIPEILEHEVCNILCDPGNLAELEMFQRSFFVSQPASWQASKPASHASQPASRTMHFVR